MFENPEFNPRWVAGLFEIGGSMGMAICGDKIHAYPYLQLQDNDEKRVEAITNRLGIGGFNPVLKSWVYRKTGWGAAELVVNSFDAVWMPSRKDIIGHFATWMILSDKERVELAKIVGSRRNSVKVDDYVNLIRDEDFFTGVIDGRCVKYDDIRFTGIYRLIITSINKPLLDALKNGFGGEVDPSIARERRLLKEGYLKEEDIKSFSWSISDRDEVENIFSHLHSSVRFKGLG